MRSATFATGLKAVFHFNRIVPKRSVFLCFLSDSVELMTLTQKKMLRYVTIRLKWKTGLKDIGTQNFYYLYLLGILAEYLISYFGRFVAFSC